MNKINVEVIYNEKEILKSIGLVITDENNKQIKTLSITSDKENHELNKFWNRFKIDENIIAVSEEELIPHLLEYMKDNITLFEDIKYDNTVFMKFIRGEEFMDGIYMGVKLLANEEINIDEMCKEMMKINIYFKKFEIDNCLKVLRSENVIMKKIFKRDEKINTVIIDIPDDYKIYDKMTCTDVVLFEIDKKLRETDIISDLISIMSFDMDNDYWTEGAIFVNETYNELKEHQRLKHIESTYRCDKSFYEKDITEMEKLISEATGYDEENVALIFENYIGDINKLVELSHLVDMKIIVFQDKE